MASLPPLLPAPRRAIAREGALRLTSDVPIVLASGSDDRDFASARALRDGIAARTGLRLPIETHTGTQGLGPHLALHREGESGEGYTIEIDARRGRLRSEGAAGLRYAVETTLQLLDARGRIPACRVEDEPVFALRGLMVDISRAKVPNDATLFELVDRCVSLKLNALMLYTEHTFRFRRHPEIGADASPLDAETLRALDAYAAERHVDLIPTLQSLGHMGHILKLDRYRHLAESDLEWSVSPAEPGTYDLLEDLFDEYLGNFRSSYFNVNGDESWDLGRGKSKAREAELGPGGVFAEHVKWTCEAVRARGRRPMLWADVVHKYPERVEQLPRDLVLLDWWYEASCDYDRVQAFKRAGFDFVVCPGTSTWNCLFPRIENSLANISGWAEAGRKHGALGMVCTDWGDFGHYNLQGNSWLGFAWAAQESWRGPAEPRDFDRAFGRWLVGETRGAAARIYRELGRVHDAGFRIPNGSPLQYLFFDDLDRAFFLKQAKAAPLRRSGARLARIRERLEGSADAFASDPLTYDELVYATDASAFAVDKALAALDVRAWYDDPSRLGARDRRALSRRLLKLVEAQRSLAKRLRRLWDRRSRPSNFEVTAGRIDESVRSLRRAARALERGKPPRTQAHDETTLGDIFRELRNRLEGRRPPAS